MAHAGGAELEQDEDECLHCSICFHTYDLNLRRPKVLPCSHTFCLTCLKTLHSETSLKCPICQRQAVGIRNVSTLPNNKYVQHIARLEEKLRDVKIQLKNYKDAIDDIIETPTSSRKLRVIDWGCLGFYVDVLAEIRIEYFVKVIRLQNPDVVFLSHIGEEVCEYLQECFPGYFFISENMWQESPSDSSGQHNRMRILRITMLNSTVSYDSHEIMCLPPVEPYDRNEPNFNILKLKAHFGEMKLKLINMDLNKDGSRGNHRQLKTIFEEVRKAEKNVNVILGVGGYLEDKEVKVVGGLPDHTVDIQKVCDKISKYEFNLDDSNRHFIESLSEEKSAHGFRTDRFFFRPASTGKVAVHDSFRIIRIPTPYTTAFDHMVLLHDMTMKYESRQQQNGQNFR